MDRSKTSSQLRERIWDRLRLVARPDSRLHYDFAHMHPDFEGSEVAAARLLDERFPGKLSLAFAAPDNSLISARALLLARGCRLVVSTYCMRRGFLLLDPARIAPSDHAFAATLDGQERFGQPIDLSAMAALGRMDLVLSGATAVAANGVRFGRSYQYFDIEWGLLTEMGTAGEPTPVAVIVHDVQVTTDRMVPMPREAVPDYIATPSGIVHLKDRPKRPVGVDWRQIDPDEIERIPALIELQRARGLRR